MCRPPFAYACLLALLAVSIVAGAQSTITYAFVGSYTEGLPDEGIDVFRMNDAGTALGRVWHGDSLVNPSFLTLAPDGRTLYACTESKMPDNGHVRAFTVDSLTGALHALNAQPSFGENPVYVSVHPAGRWLVVANYTGSGITLYALRPDGGIGAAVQHIDFTDAGSGHVPDRQEASHVHAAVFSPDGKHLFVPDLGTDRIHVFAFNSGDERPLRSLNGLDVQAAPGSGPRHLVFHPDGRTAYCIEELGGTLAVYHLEGAHLQLLQRLPSYATAPPVGSSADVHVSPDGLFVHTSNRAPEHSIAVFAVDPSTGQLTAAGHFPAGGVTPRGFAISPDGAHVLVANSGSDKVVLFQRDAHTGALRPTGIALDMPGVASVVWRTYAVKGP
jgi:6-phosphogluconolactonase